MHNLLIAATLAATPALAFASGCPETLAKDTVLGTSLTEVQDSLKAMGYEIRKGEAEDGKIEVYFTGPDLMGEVYVSPETGKITKMECKK